VVELPVHHLSLAVVVQILYLAPSHQRVAAAAVQPITPEQQGQLAALGVAAMRQTVLDWRVTHLLQLRHKVTTVETEQRMDAAAAAVQGVLEQMRLVQTVVMEEPRHHPQ
jgi:hypothetical protein